MPKMCGGATDAELVALWLHGKRPHTIWAYGDGVTALRRFTGRPLRATYLSDLQPYADILVGALASRGRRLKTLKSLLSFAIRMGYLPFNAGAASRARPEAPSTRS
jgi:integrase/recombinase XerD